jgi:hypothetical protein
LLHPTRERVETDKQSQKKGKVGEANSNVSQNENGENEYQHKLIARRKRRMESTLLFRGGL